MKKTLITVGKYLIFLSIGFFLLFLVYGEIDLQEFINQLKSGHYIWMIVALGCAVFSHLFRALRWNLLINSLGYKTSATTTFYAVMVGYLANTAVPRMGEVSRCGMLTKREKIPFSPLFGSVISERIFDLFVLLFLIFLVFVFQIDLIGGFLDTYIYQPIAGSLAGKAWLLALIGLVVVGGIATLVYLIKSKRDYLLQFKLYQKIESFAKELYNGVKTIKYVRQKGLFVFYTFMIWFMYLLMIYFPFFILDATSHLDIADALTVLVIGSLGMVAPVPGGIGAYHYIVNSLLITLYGIQAGAAGSFAFISHAGQTLMIIVIGAISYFLILLGKRPALNNYEDTEIPKGKDNELGDLKLASSKVDC